jgi:hypothetical protein
LLSINGRDDDGVVGDTEEEEEEAGNCTAFPPTKHWKLLMNFIGILAPVEI